MSTNAPKRPFNEGVNRTRSDGVNTTAGANSNRGVNPTNSGARPAPSSAPPAKK